MKKVSFNIKLECCMRIYIFLLFLVSCQSLQTQNSSILFFSGLIEIQDDQKKVGYKVEVYKKRNESVFRVDVLGPLNQVLLSYLWDNKDYFLIFPFNKAYYKSQISPFKESVWWAVLIKNPQWFLQILNQNLLSPWICDFHTDIDSKKKSSSIQKCSLNSMTVEWRSNKIFAQAQGRNQKFHLQLKIQNISIKKSKDLFNIQPPSNFKKVKKILLKL